jgi:hypothetical protein
MDGAAGLAPKKMAGLYSVAFVLAMIAWALGILFLIALFIAMIFGEGGGGQVQGLEGYGELQPKKREPLR